ncbi:MAG TPA: TIGR03557 family F420-dependent LLM class oxidoreductase [Methanotrichaceae archaeon]|nr:TIGR03557 family F420-dependent LLM class oxidoreductase [Methanotrichaceae archaeon]
MVEVGYKLSSEENGPLDLVCYAKQAEDAGFAFAMISDHYHPWIDRQGHSPFVWGVIGGISQTTTRLRLSTGVTCPTVRIHPAIIAQAAATAAAMMPGRFILGVGSGENLNEHILGDRWPPAPLRLEMLEEAVEIIRLLWEGGSKDYNGAFYTVENARIYTLPEELPPIMVASGGERSAKLAARIGDGLVTSGNSKEIIEIFKRSGGEGKPVYSEISVCFAMTEEEAKRIAYEYWPITANKGELNQDLPTPMHFEKLASMVKPEDVVKNMPTGPDPQKYIDRINEFQKAGADHVFVHQVGPRQPEFIRFFKEEVLPEFGQA